MSGVRIAECSQALGLPACVHCAGALLMPLHWLFYPQFLNAAIGDCGLYTQALSGWPSNAGAQLYVASEPALDHFSQPVVSQPLCS